jgi:hypothetical protein
MCGCSDDGVDEGKLVLCCALCCVNCSTYANGKCWGVSGKLGLCCISCEFCFNPSAACLPCVCCGPQCQGCESLCNIQGQLLCVSIQGAFPCTDDVPAALTALGLTVYPCKNAGCCVSVESLKMDR